MSTELPPPALSIVVPAFEEEENLRPLVDEIAVEVIEAGVLAEVVFVDDGSRDGTPEVLAQLAAERTWIRVLTFAQNRGKSAAMAAGYRAARGPLVATLDADLQNHPADLVEMLDAFADPAVALVQGDRTANRQDGWHRKLATAIGRLARRTLLGDRVRDTGCATRILRADVARALPLQFRGMHRFVPICVQMMGGDVVERPVRHRERFSGTSKYGLGLYNRGTRGLYDTFAVRWMLRRWERSDAAELGHGGQPREPDRGSEGRAPLEEPGSAPVQASVPAEVRR